MWTYCNIEVKRGKKTMAAEAQWLFITDKYSLLELIDSAIVVARFNQNELMRELIEARCKLLETKSYEDLGTILEILHSINKKVTDKHLKGVLAKLIDQTIIFKEGEIEFDDKVRTVESKAID